MSVRKAELTRSRRPSGPHRTYEVAYDREKRDYARIDSADYVCCYCGNPVRGTGYRHGERIACPQHLNDVRGPDAGPPPQSSPAPVPKAAPKRKRG